MSDELPYRSEGRNLSPIEKDILIRLIVASGPENSHFLSRLADLRVEAMSDGHMGSLYIVHPTKTRAGRRFGRELAMLMTKDSDSVDVSISLNLDDGGDLYELDIWKTDFTPVVKLNLEPPH